MKKQNTPANDTRVLMKTGGSKPPSPKQLSFVLAQFLDGHGLLAFAAAQVVETGTTDFAGLRDFDLGNLGAVDRENTFHTFSIRDLTDGESFVQACTFVGNDDAREDLNTLFVAFDNSGMDFHTVTHIEGSDVLLELFRINFGDDVAHNVRGEVGLADHSHERRMGRGAEILDAFLLFATCFSILLARCGCPVHIQLDDC